MERPIALVAAAALALAGCSDEVSSEPRFDGERAFGDLRAQVEIGPRPAGSKGGAEVVRLIAGRLREAGVDDVRIQRPWRNVVATIPGSEPGVVVVGAHHDTKSGIGFFVGANDGASGVAVVLELARALVAEAPLRGPSIRLALFDAEEARSDRPFEEDGLRGSRQYLVYAKREAQGSPALGEIRAMVLFDMVGDCDLRIPREANSDPGLYRSFAEAAEEVDGSTEPFVGEAGTLAVADDHLPFVEAGIPALDVIDFTYGLGPSPGAYWHTMADTLDKVCVGSLDAVGEAAVRALPSIGR